LPSLPLGSPFTVTTTVPVVVPLGTVATMLVVLQLLTLVAALPLNVTVLVPCVAPKFVPVIVTAVPTGPPLGDIKRTSGNIVYVGLPVLATPPTVTTTGPVVVPLGTITTMLVELQLITLVAAVPLKVTVLVPCVAPKFVPVIVTCVLIPPELGDIPVMLG